MMNATNQPGKLAREIHVAKTICVIIALFMMCWMPFFVINMVWVFCSDFCNQKKHYRWVIHLSKMMHYANSMMNFFVYAVRLPDFRRVFKAILFKCDTSAFRERVRTFSESIAITRGRSASERQSFVHDQLVTNQSSMTSVSCNNYDGFVTNKSTPSSYDGSLGNTSPQDYTSLADQPRLNQEDQHNLITNNNNINKSKNIQNNKTATTVNNQQRHPFFSQNAKSKMLMNKQASRLSNYSNCTEFSTMDETWSPSSSENTCSNSGGSYCSSHGHFHSNNNGAVAVSSI